MKPEQIDDLLKRTLSDSRVSRGEKKILQAMVGEQEGDPQKLAFLHHRAFELARQELIGPDAIQVLEWLEGVVKAFKEPAPLEMPDVAAYFSPGADCLDEITSLFRRARKRIDVCVFTITDNRIVEEMIQAHQRKVTMRVITDDDKSLDRGSDIDRLEDLGVPVRKDRSRHHMHHKYAVFDGRTTLTGSYNWTRSAAEYNEENIVVSEDARLSTRFTAHFEQLWKEIA
ncbi:MAG: phospholipase D-like domain-containing protein [Pirellulaceae bacterium]|jgi:cardiolipin hydrolase|nr:phospholipase D-like domain-containing protein [Pirellulaceae bacterium]